MAKDIKDDLIDLSITSLINCLEDLNMKEQFVKETPKSKYQEIIKFMREESTVIQMRDFHNWIKLVLISNVTEFYKHGKISLLDISTGRGGDLSKWKKAHINHVFAFDISEQSINSTDPENQGAKERLKGLKKKGINWERKWYPMNNFNGGLKAIISQIKSKNPVLIDTTLYGVNTGHTVVISGYDETQKRIIITDPYIEAPGLRILGEDEFKKIWNSKGAGRALVLTSGNMNAISLSDEKGVALSPEIVKQAESGDEEAQRLANQAEAGAARAKQELEQLKSNAVLETSAAELVKMAEAGDANAQFKLGQCHEKGYMGIKDNKEAVKWYAKSAEQGYTKAEFVLSLCYSEGKGVLRNKKEAEDWIAKVLAHANADELYAFSQYRLNNPMDGDLRWISEFSEVEFRCLKKSAELGNVVAQAQLGNFYSSGRYVNRDQIEAVKWWTKSADQGNANAQFKLGMCYKYGSGVAKDWNEAIKWLNKAANQNYANSKWHLEEIYSMPKKGY